MDHTAIRQALSAKADENQNNLKRVRAAAINRALGDAIDYLKNGNLELGEEEGEVDLKLASEFVFLYDEATSE